MSGSKFSHTLDVVIAMVAAGDAAVLDDERVLRELGSPECWPLVLQAAEVVAQCWRSFDYSRSPEFKRSIEGRSPSYTRMATRLTAGRAKEHQRRLEVAIGDRNEAELARLLPPDECATLVRAIHSLMST